MYVDIDSRNMISINDITADDALRLSMAINASLHFVETEAKERMMQLSKSLVEHFKISCKNERLIKIPGHGE